MSEEWRNPDNSDETNAVLDAFVAEQETPAFRHGYDLGYSMGVYEDSQEAIAAYDAGEIDLWIEFTRPKSIEEWNAWEAKHGPSTDFPSRWTKQ